MAWTFACTRARCPLGASCLAGEGTNEFRACSRRLQGLREQPYGKRITYVRPGAIEQRAATGEDRVAQSVSRRQLNRRHPDRQEAKATTCVMVKLSDECRLDRRQQERTRPTASARLQVRHRTAPGGGNEAGPFKDEIHESCAGIQLPRDRVGELIEPLGFVSRSDGRSVRSAGRRGDHCLCDLAVRDSDACPSVRQERRRPGVNPRRADHLASDLALRIRVREGREPVAA